jgi:thioredoxin reductase (NADPH)
MDPATHEVLLDGGERVRARSVIVATGVSWRRLVIDGFDRFIGKGIYYGAARSEAASTRGQDVYLIGAGNSAGQTALHFANHARRVTLLVRGDSLEKSMSRYLVEQIAGKSNIAARLHCTVQAGGEAHLEAIDIADRQAQTVTRHE